jgi:pimeloyl-ACP methyl ester carboxylesterase
VLPARPALDVPADRFVSLDDVRFDYLDWGGDGAPLLMLAGLGCTAHVYAELAPHLTDRFRVVALTRRGHGLTAQVESGFALEDAAEDARRLMDTLGIERAHLVGHSMGCGEISVLAARHPERVASLVYVDGAFDWADSPTRPEDSPDNTSPSVRVVRRVRRPRSQAHAWLRRNVGSRFRRDAAHLRREPSGRLGDRAAHRRRRDAVRRGP